MLVVVAVVNILAQEAQDQVELVAVVTELWTQTAALELPIQAVAVVVLAEVQPVVLAVTVALEFVLFLMLGLLNSLVERLHQLAEIQYIHLLQRIL
jgi:hypothetical protein